MNNYISTAKRPTAIDRQRNKTTKTIADIFSDGAIIIDVRTINEFDRAKISGARHIAYDQLYMFLDQIKKWNVPVIVYSSHGYRSKLACDFLRKARIKVIDGGSKQELEERLFAER